MSHDTETLSVRLHTDLIHWLNDWALAHHVTVSQMLRMAVGLYVQRIAENADDHALAARLIDSGIRRYNRRVSPPEATSKTHS